MPLFTFILANLREGSLFTSKVQPVWVSPPWKNALRTSTATRLDLTFQDRTHKRVNQTHSTVLAMVPQQKTWHWRAWPLHTRGRKRTHRSWGYTDSPGWSLGLSLPGLERINWTLMFTFSGKTVNLGVNSFLFSEKACVRLALCVCACACVHA